jgi:hypothetical protein
VVRNSDSIGHTRANGESRAYAKRASGLNVVCLMGRLSGQVSAEPLPAGWSHRVLEVARETLDGDGDAGVFDVLLVLSPGLTSSLGQRAQAGDTATVVGRLNIDVQYSHKPPLAHYSVVAHRVELVPTPPYAVPSARGRAVGNY